MPVHRQAPSQLSQVLNTRPCAPLSHTHTMCPPTTTPTRPAGAHRGPQLPVLLEERRQLCDLHQGVVHRLHRPPRGRVCARGQEAAGAAAQTQGAGGRRRGVGAGAGGCMSFARMRLSALGALFSMPLVHRPAPCILLLVIACQPSGLGDDTLPFRDACRGPRRPRARARRRAAAVRDPSSMTLTAPSRPCTPLNLAPRCRMLASVHPCCLSLVCLNLVCTSCPSAGQPYVPYPTHSYPPPAGHSGAI